MAAEMDLGTLQISVADALARLDELEKKLAETGEKAKKTGKDAGDALGGVGKKISEADDKATHMFAEATGGRAFAHDLREVQEGLSIAGDKAVGTAARFQALGSSLIQGAGIIGATIGAVVEGATALYDSMQQATQAAIREEAATQRLGISMRDLAAASHEAVNADQALGIREQLAAQGVHEYGAKLQELIQGLQQFADIHGGTATDSLTRFSQAVQQGDNVALAAFGVHIDTATTGAVRMRQAISQLNGETERWSHMLVSQEEFARQQGRDVRDVTYDYQEYRRAILAGMSAIREHRQEQLAAKTQIEEFQHSVQNAIGVMAGPANQRALAFATTVEHIKQAVHDAAIEMNRASSAATLFAFNADRGVEQMEQRLRGARQMIANARAEREQNASLRRILHDEGVRDSELGFLGGNAGGGAVHDQYAALEHALQRAIALDQKRGEEEAKVTDQLRAQRDLLTTQITRELDKEADALRAMREEMSADISGGEAKHDEAKRQAEDARQLNDTTLQVRGVFLNSHAQMQTAAQTTADVVGNAYESMTGAFKTHLAAFIQGRESLADAAKGILEDTLLSIATESAVKAVFYGAAAIAAAFTPGGQAQAAGYGAAAAEYAAVAVLAGAGAGAMYASDRGASTGASGGAGFSGPMANGAGPPSTSGGGGPTYIITVNGALLNEGVEHGVVRALDNAAQRGIRPRDTRSLMASR